MKDNLFEMLLNLFERSLTQLQKSHKSVDETSKELINDQDLLVAEEEEPLFIKAAHHHSMRVVTCDERMKMTKASYQFIMRMKLWQIIDTEVFELILNQVQSSDSHIVTLQETKWIIRTTLEKYLSEEQLAFLDLVLYQSEDATTKH